MVKTSKQILAVLLAVTLASIGGAWELVSPLHAAAGPTRDNLDRSRLVRSAISASIQNEKGWLRDERIKLANRIAAVERVRTENTILGRRVRDRLKRVVAILEILDLPAADRTKRFDELGMSRSYRGADLVVKMSNSEKIVKNLGRPVHPAQFLENGNMPDGGAARIQYEWEQDWEDVQIEAEDTVVAIEGLSEEAAGWVTDLENWGNQLQYISSGARAFDVNQELSTASTIENRESPDGGTEACSASGTTDADSKSDCIEAVGAAVSEALAAIGAYLGNSEAVKAALTNARNAVGVAMGAFTAGTLTLEGLGAAAGTAIAALAGSTAAGWIAAAAIAVGTATIVYAVWNNCPPPYEPEPMDLAESYQ